MRHLALICLLLAALFLSAMLLISCNQPVEVQDTGCANNVPPVIGNLSFLVDGIGVAFDNACGCYPFNADDVVFIAYQFKDDDCNLAGGKIYIRIDGVSGWEAVEKFGYDIPCNVWEAEEPVGFDWELSKYDLPPGTYVLSTGWVDGCGDASNVESVNFRINEPEAE